MNFVSAVADEGLGCPGTPSQIDAQVAGLLGDHSSTGFEGDPVHVRQPGVDLDEEHHVRRRRNTVSTVKKWQASMGFACAVWPSASQTTDGAISGR